MISEKFMWLIDLITYTVTGEPRNLAQFVHKLGEENPDIESGQLEISIEILDNTGQRIDLERLSYSGMYQVFVKGPGADYRYELSGCRPPCRPLEAAVYLQEKGFTVSINGDAEEEGAHP